MPPEYCSWSWSKMLRQSNIMLHSPMLTSTFYPWISIWHSFLYVCFINIFALARFPWSSSFLVLVFRDVRSEAWSKPCSFSYSCKDVLPPAKNMYYLGSLASLRLSWSIKINQAYLTIQKAGSIRVLLISCLLHWRRHETDIRNKMYCLADLVFAIASVAYSIIFPLCSIMRNSNYMLLNLVLLFLVIFR